jgi:DNA polymerase elongation subunit (family B)
MSNYTDWSEDEINAEIRKLRKMSDDLKNEELGIKLTLNSIYGALGNQYFACFNTEVAESVTLQGQDLIKFAEKIINKYFHEHWHLDTELHEKIGARNVRPVTAEMVIYVDTDSNYVNFGNIISSCEFDGEPLDLILKINEHRLASYITKCLDVYAKKWNTINYQDFELEAISRNAIFLGKKKYIVNLTYEAPGKHYVDLSRIKPTGIEIVQGGTPPFAREKLIFLLKHLFETGRKFEIRTFVKMLREIKSEFKIQKPESISIGVGVNNIEKFILNDTTKFEVAKGCPMHVRASGYHNYILNNSKYKSKYSLIRSSEKIKYYFVAVNSEQENNVFGYLNGSYPYEYAPPIDFDAQFNRTILDPINRFIEVMGYSPLSPNLLLVSALF